MARINIRFRLRRDKSDNWEENDPVLEAGEPGYELDTHLLRIGNGVNRFSELPAISPGSQGLPGDPGIPGADGAPGPKGDKGDPGLQGADGAPGPKGDKGDTGPQGIQGIEGPTGDQGPMGPGGADGHSFNFKGLWDALTNFAQNDVVYYQGSSWIALNPSTGSEPSESSTDWDEMAMAGAPGAQGVQGPQGLQGLQGDPGPKGDKGDTGTPGATGADGPKGDPGTAGRGFNPRGAWDSKAAYAVDDIALYAGSTYRAKAAVAVPVNTPPPANPIGGDGAPLVGQIGTDPVNGTLTTADVYNSTYGDRYFIRITAPGTVTFTLVNNTTKNARILVHTWNTVVVGQSAVVATGETVTLTMNFSSAADYTVRVESTYWGDSPNGPYTITAAPGTATIQNPASNPDPASASASWERWASKGDKGDAGVAPARIGMSLVTASLPANGREKLSGGMAFYAANAYKITSNRPARVRFYTTTAKRDADASRAIGTDPTGDHGVLLDVVFTSSMLSLDLSPTVMLHNEESPRIKSLGYIVDNLDANAGTVNINVDFQVIE